MRPARRTAALAAVSLATMLAACATAPPLPAPDASHPASPDAAAAPEPQATPTLQMPERTPRATGNGRRMKGH